MGARTATRALGRWPALAMALSAALLCLPPGPVAAATKTWLTGTALQRRLATPIDLLWSGVALRDALKSLADTQDVAILLDRRVDPGQLLRVSIRQSPLSAVLQEIAYRQEIAVCMVGPVAYFGPAETVHRLRTVVALRAEEAAKLPTELSRRLSRSEPMAWDDLAEPRQLLEDLARQGRLKLHGLEQVPHDLWAAASLPPLPLLERIALVAAQFDLTCTIDAAGVATLQPIPAEVAIVRSYDGGRQPEHVARQFASLAPHAQIKIAGEKVWVKGLLEDHEQIAAPRQPANHPPTPTHPPNTAPGDEFARSRYTLKVVEKPLGPVLEQLAAQMQLELRIDRGQLQQAGASLDQRVTFSVKEATVDELFAAALKSTGLTAHRRGKVLEIGPAEK